MWLPLICKKPLPSLQTLIASGTADINVHYRYAQYLLVAKAYEQAIPVLNHVLELLPSHGYALNDLGVIHYLKNDFDAAVRYYSRSLEVDPRNHNALRNYLCLLRDLESKERMVRLAKEVTDRASTRVGGIDQETVAVLREFNLVGEPPKQSLGDGRQVRKTPHDIQVMSGTLISPDSSRRRLHIHRI